MIEEYVISIALAVLLAIWALSRSSKIESSAMSSDPLPSRKLSRLELAKRGYKLADFTVTGVHIPIRKNYILESCTIGDKVTLEHEKNNRFSSRAIMVRHYGKKIGYIPEVYLTEVHELLNGHSIVFISEIELDIKYLTVHITIAHH